MKCLCYSTQFYESLPLSVGHHARPTAVDWHNSKRQDLLVTHKGGPEGPGVTLFRVAARAAGSLPIFDEGIRLSFLDGATAMTAYPNFRESRFDLYCARDGSLWQYPNVGTPNDPHFGSPVEHPFPLEIQVFDEVAKLSPAFIEPDSPPGLLVGVIQTSDYLPRPAGAGAPAVVGIDSKGQNIGYGEDGNWLGGTTQSHIFWLKNYRTVAEPDFALGAPLLVDGRPLTVDAPVGATSIDWERDGKEDLLTVDERGELCVHYSINREHVLRELTPRFSVSEGAADSLYNQQANLAAADIDRDGEDELLIGTRAGAILATRRLPPESDQPIRCSDPFPILSMARRIHLGEFPVPVAVDWNGDGHLDLVVGTAEGQLLLLENVGTNPAPAFALPQPLPCEDETPTSIATGPAVMGPLDEHMSYLCPEAVDWDADGLLDIIFTDSSGRVHLSRNVGSLDSPLFAPAVPILKGDEPLQSQWKVRPTCVDWNDDGLPELLTVDSFGFLNLYQRDGDRLQPGRHLLDRLGRPIRLDGSFGACGQACLCACDWDGDGDIDILVGVPGRSGFWTGLSGDASEIAPLPTVVALENIASTSEPRFAPRCIRHHGLPLHFGSTGCAPHAAHWSGHDFPDLIVGSDDGVIYTLDRAELDW